MRKLLLIFLLLVTACPLLRAADTNFLTTLSPNLRKFLTDHRTALNAFTDAWAESFSNRTARVYYFYSENPKERNAHHFYPENVGMPDVAIFVAHDSYPVDEYIGVLYETMNSRGQSRFVELMNQANEAKISRTDFAEGVLRIEFDAVIGTRELLLHLGLSRKEIKQSHYFHFFAEMPTDYAAYRKYQNSLYRDGQDAARDYESQYDEIQKRKSSSPTTKPQ